jgi:hypothetical protein
MNTTPQIPAPGTECAEFGYLENKAARYDEVEAILAPLARDSETAVDILRRLVAQAAPSLETEKDPK